MKKFLLALACGVALIGCGETDESIKLSVETCHCDDKCCHGSDCDDCCPTCLDDLCPGPCPVVEPVKPVEPVK